MEIAIDPRSIELYGPDTRPTTGLIPSQQLEEKRKAFVRPEFDYSHKSCNVIYVMSSLLFKITDPFVLPLLRL